MSLSCIQSLKGAAVLEDCSDQLDILGHTLTVQMSRQRGAAAAQEKARLTKLTKDYQYISQQMCQLHLEVEEKQRCSSLLQVMEEEEQKKAEDMKRNVKGKLEQRRQTVLQQQEEIYHKNANFKSMDHLCEILTIQLNNQSLEISSKKIEEENAELPLQVTQTCQDEKLLEQKQLKQKQLKQQVMGVHEESEKFLQNQHEELQQLLHKWQQDTMQMLQETKSHLNDVCCKNTFNADRLMDMRKQFGEMEQLVIEDMEEQEKLCQQQAEITAATKLQAWWRGCMVRRGLGSFKKAEDNKKGKKKKKKEGNKNTTKKK